MPKDNPGSHAAPTEPTDSPPDSSKDLEISLVELTTALIEHAKHLERHIHAMENLTKALKLLDSTIKKEVTLESSQPSIELKEAITAFLEHNVNPKYYQDTGFLRLAVPDTKIPQTGRKSKR
jgi:hypothetical protein